MLPTWYAVAWPESAEESGQLKRREFITLLGGAATRGRSRRVRSSRTDAADRRADGVFRERPGRTRHVAAFRQDFRSSGGRTAATFGSTFAGRPDTESMQRYAKELIALQPDLILSSSTPATATLLQQTRTIPIIFASLADPVGSGFVASLSRPGGNVTGFTIMELAGRQVAGVAQGDCAACRPGRLLVQPGNCDICRILPESLQSCRCVVRRGGIAAPVHDMSELESAVAAQAREPNSGLIVMPDAFTIAIARSHIAGGSLPASCHLSVPSLSLNWWPAVLRK